MMETILQSYSEATIKTQGSYSLKGIAAITESLNKTLTRTIGSPIDLSGRAQIKFDIYASRTGSNIKIGFRDSGLNVIEHTPNALATNTWQTETVDISGVSNANKDAIDRMIITILNADAANTFYLDNIISEFTLLVVADGSQGQAVNNAALTQLHNLTVAGGAQDQAVENVALTQLYNLVLADGLQGQSVGNVLLSHTYNLIVAGGMQTQEVEDIFLNKVYNLILANGYKIGNNYFFCPICGFRKKVSEGKYNSNKEFVCNECWDPKHPQESVRARVDRISARISRPEPTDTFIDVTDVGWEDL